MKILVAEDILKVNKDYAGEIRAELKKRGITMLNLISSPGAGKTALLEKTLAAMEGKYRMAVIEADLYTALDAGRLERQGVEVVQINTRGACHTDASLVGQALKEISLDGLELIFLENVGNLVCPAEFDLGEDHKVVLLSVAEGSDKPPKYPLAFTEASLALITKADLLPYCPFDVKALEGDLRRINPDLEIIQLSCVTEEGIERWLDWLSTRVARKLSAAG